MRTLLVVVFLALYAVGFILWVYQPYTERINDLRVKLDGERNKLMAAQAIFHRLDEINAKIAELEASMAELDLLIPGDNRVAYFLYSCGQWERSTGARVRDMVFTDPSATGDYEEYQVNFTVVGTYAAQVGFLAKLEGMDRLVRVDSVSVVPKDTTAPAEIPVASDDGSEMSATPPSPFATVDVTTAKYMVHLFVDPGKADEAAQETPGDGLDFNQSEGRNTPFLP